MDIIELHHQLGAAYTRYHVGADRNGAVAALRGALGTAPARELARKHLASLAAIVEARTRGARCGCYVTKTAHDLLSDALKGQDAA
jgi:hypothetical protein